MQAKPTAKPNEKSHAHLSAKPVAPSSSGTGQAFGAPAGMPLFLRPKLAISQPGDAAEAEADQIAHQMMRMPAPVMQRQCANGESGGPPCPACRERETAKVSRKADSGTVGDTPNSVHSTLRSPGQLLPVSTQAFFTPRFGRDLSHVRVHTNSEAQQSARDVNALAYTVGSHVVFGAGRYSPESSEGLHLLAHELTHVVQQEGNTGLLARQTVAGASAGVPLWHPGVAHDHTPTERWADVQADARASCTAQAAAMEVSGPTIGGVVDASIACACATLSPAQVLDLAGRTVLSGSPLGQAHLDHYLIGGGVNLAENLDDVLRRDAGVRSVLAAAIGRNTTGFVTIAQADYAVDDFRNAFGSIDRMDYEVDTAAGTVHVWFQDRYEWHPVGFGYSALPGDGRRGTNCVHAAAVEMQSSGAQDYWMFGNATVPLTLITGVIATGSRARE